MPSVRYLVDHLLMSGRIGLLSGMAHPVWRRFPRPEAIPADLFVGSRVSRERGHPRPRRQMREAFAPSFPKWNWVQRKRQALDVEIGGLRDVRGQGCPRSGIWKLMN